MIRLQVSGGSSEVAPQPGRVESHSLHSLLHGTLGAGRVVRREELLYLLGGRLGREVLRRGLDEAREQEAAL